MNTYLNLLTAVRRGLSAVTLGLALVFGFVLTPPPPSPKPPPPRNCES
ncbi:MAG: hypothetical protein MJE68_04780 [Proteobacteria bacterium]|nr:hypothetical protein [Pseudomonadota bacterium]